MSDRYQSFAFVFKILPYAWWRDLYDSIDCGFNGDVACYMLWARFRSHTLWIGERSQGGAVAFFKSNQFRWNVDTRWEMSLDGWFFSALSKDWSGRTVDYDVYHRFLYWNTPWASTVVQSASPTSVPLSNYLTVSYSAGLPRSPSLRLRTEHNVPFS